MQYRKEKSNIKIIVTIMNTLTHCQLFLWKKKRIAVKPHIHTHTHTHTQRTAFFIYSRSTSKWVTEQTMKSCSNISPSSQVCLDVKWDHIAWNNNLLTKKMSINHLIWMIWDKYVSKSWPWTQLQCKAKYWCKK